MLSVTFFTATMHACVCACVHACMCVCTCVFSQEDYRGFVTSLFVEKLNYLVVSSLDGKICEH